MSKTAIKNIEVNGFNRAIDKTHVARLVKSIQQLGQLEPILLTKSLPERHPKHEYLLIAGLHRLEAMKALKETEIAAVFTDVKSLDEIMQLCAAENTVRKDTQPWEDAELMQKIFGVDDPPTVKEVAAALGVKEDWVIRRRRLVNLTPAVLKAWAQQPDIPVATMEAIALLPKDAQGFPDGEEGLSGWDPESILASLRRSSGDLTKAPWDLQDFNPKGCVSSKCANCRFNTAKCQELFTADELKEVGKMVCTNEDCFDLKGDAWLDGKVEEFLKTKTGTLLSTSTHTSENGVLIQDKWAKVKAGVPGALLGLLIDGPDIGKTINFKLVTAQAIKQQEAIAKGEAPVKDDKAKLEDRKQMLQNKRDTHLVEAFLKLLTVGKAESLPVTLPVVVFMAATVGTTSNGRHAEGFDFYKTFDAAADEALWVEVIPVLAQRWKIHNMKQDCPKIVPEIRAFAKLIGYDLKPLDTAAENAHPKPKSLK